MYEGYLNIGIKYYFNYNNEGENPYFCLEKYNRIIVYFNKIKK